MTKARVLTAREIIWVAVPIVALALAIFAWGTPVEEPSVANDLDDINAVIDSFEDAYSNEQLNDLRNLFFAEAVIAYDCEEGRTQRVHELEDWLAGTQEVTFDLNEFISDTLSNREITVFRNIAYVVCDYEYLDDNEVGIGIDIFTLMKMRNRWRILSLQFTGDQAQR